MPEARSPLARIDRSGPFSCYSRDMEGIVPLCAFGLLLGLLMTAVAFAKGAMARDGRAFLGLVFLEASLYFLAELLGASGGSRTLVLALDYGSLFYGLPSLYFYARSALGRAVEWPFRHYIPALAAIPLGTGIAFYAEGRSDGGGIAAGIYIALALCGESLQLALYGRALLLLCSPRRGIVEGEWPRRTVIAALVGYGAFLLISWIGFGSSILGELEGRRALPLPGLDLGSLLVVALLVWTLGLCALWGGRASASKEPEAGLGAGPKYGGRPLPKAELKRIVGRARTLLAAAPDLGAAVVEPRRLAARLGLPYYLLSRAVNEEEGASLGDLVNEYRIERAKALLRGRPELSVLDVALESGFQAKSTFNEVFKKRVGASPREYRQAAGK